MLFRIEGEIGMKKEVLIVEDSHLTRLMVKRVLEERGYVVTQSATGEEALSKVKLRSKPFDLVIMDVYLSGMDGLRTLELLKQEPEYTYVPVMMLTVASAVSVVKQAIELGAVDYLCKPFTPEQLVARVEKLIGPARDEDEPLQKFYRVVRCEINRANRGKTSLVLLLIQFSKTPSIKIAKLAEEIQKRVREIDTVLPLSEHSLVAVLPLTDRKGAEVVVGKIGTWFSQIGEKEEWQFSISVYPENGADAQELLSYARSELSKAKTEK
jgi:CheY-like chemotaxis protein